MKRAANFYAGPSTLPLEVLEQIRDTIVDYQGRGLSLLETSHRSDEYDQVHQAAVDSFRSLLGVPDNFRILLLGGGASLQFSMVPLNLLGDGGACDFVVSGAWAQKALDDAKKVGGVNVLYDGAGTGYSTLPDSLVCSESSRYLHITSNETIDGLQWKRFPETGSTPIVADMSSDILSRSFSFDSFGLIYAGAQKNLGPAGVTVVLIRDDLVDRAPESLTTYLRYQTHAEKNSLYNTPPVFSIYALKLVMDWVKNQGGLSALEKRNEEKAGLIYNEIDRSGGFYTCKVAAPYRSTMNVVFRLPDETLERRFIAEAERQGMLGLKGHRSVGGCRASLYNALPLAWARALAGFMTTFRENNT